jgi:hypothetical protein
MVTTVPSWPLPGENPEMIGAGGDESVKFAADIAVPVGVVTEIFPVVVPVGTLVLICVSLATVNAAAVPLNETAVAPVSRFPVITTAVPSTPAVGAKAVIEGVVTTGGGGVLLPPPQETIASIRVRETAAGARRNCFRVLALTMVHR